MLTSFYSQWDAALRLPPSVLLRHASLSRSVGLPATTSPLERDKELAKRPADMRAEFERKADEYVALWDAATEWTPDDYDPTFTDPMELFRNDLSFQILGQWGGRGGQKTFRSSDFVVEEASTAKLRVIVAREFAERIIRSAKPDLEDAIKRSNWSHDWQIMDKELRNTKTGSTVQFTGFNEDPESAGKSISAADRLILDEAQLLSVDSLEHAIPSLRRPGSRILLSWNSGKMSDCPVDQWLRHGGTPDRALVAGTMLWDNPFAFRSTLVETMLEMWVKLHRTNLTRYRWIWAGGHMDSVEAAILPTDNIKQGVLDTEGQNGRGWVGIDFNHGGQDAAAVAGGWIFEGAVSDFNPSGLDILYIVGAWEKSGRVPMSELIKVAEQFESYFNPERGIICDHVPEKIEALRDAGLRVDRTYKYAGSVVDTFDFMAEHLIIVHSSTDMTGDCYNQLRGLRWKADRLTGRVTSPMEVAAGCPDHIADAIRMGIGRTAPTDDALKKAKRSNVTINHIGRKRAS